MDVDLFGEPVCGTEAPPVQTHTEKFDLAADLSRGERQIIASYLAKHAAGLTSSLYADEKKKGYTLLNEAERYAGCGHERRGFYCPDDGSKYWINIACRSRICERCGRIYKKKLERRMLPLIRKVTSQKRKGYVLALLTLTVTTKRWGDGMPERDDIKRLYTETSKFLRLYYGKYKARLSKSGKVVEQRKKKKQLKPGESNRIYIGGGWIATLEVGTDNNNAHCHAIVHGPYRSLGRLREKWQNITGDSWNVDIKAIRTPKEVVNYVLKYITKPPQTESYHRIADYAVMIKGSRRLRSGGIFYNAFTLDKKDAPTCTCIYCHRRLVMEHDILKTDECDDRLDLYAIKRQIEAGEYNIAEAQNVMRFLPPGVTPVSLTN